MHGKKFTSFFHISLFISSFSCFIFGMDQTSWNKSIIIKDLKTSPFILRYNFNSLMYITSEYGLISIKYPTKLISFSPNDGIPPPPPSFTDVSLGGVVVKLLYIACGTSGPRFKPGNPQYDFRDWVSPACKLRYDQLFKQPTHPFHWSAFWHSFTAVKI